MTRTADAARTFLGYRRIAVTGVSHAPRGHGSNAVYGWLKENGYLAFAVNPTVAQVEEGTDGRERLGPDGPVHPAAALVACHQAGVVELAHVEGQRGLGDAEGVGKMAGARRPGLRLGQIAQQADPGGVGEGLEDVGEHVGLGRREQLAVRPGAAEVGLHRSHLDAGRRHGPHRTSSH